MPLNSDESYNELIKYRQLYCSVHSSYQFSFKNFIKVPPKTIIVTSTNDNSISSHDQLALYYDLIDIKNYLVKILLTENDDIPEYHKLHNKTIYMPNSCIPNLGIQFAKNDEKDTNILGIFDINKNIWNNNEYDEIDTENEDKTKFNKEKFSNASIVPEKYSNRRNLYLEDVIKIINDHIPNEYGYIIFIDGCTDLYGIIQAWFLTKKEQNRLIKNSGEKNNIDLSTEYSKYNRECVLDSLQKFTAKFTFFENPTKYLSLSHYRKYKYNFTPNKIYKKKYKKENKYVNKYFSKLSDVKEENEDADIFYNKSGESVGTVGMSMSTSMSKSEPNRSKSNVFGEYLSKQVRDILSPPPKTLSPKELKVKSPRRSTRSKKSPKKSSPKRKIQPVRRSSRIASSRKVYDGKKRRRRSSKLKSRRKY